MINIDLNNYEAYCIDYIEGSLSENEAMAFNAFLEQHPEILAQLSDFEIIPLMPEPVVYHGKSMLKKGAVLNPTFDEQCFEYIEGNMNAVQAKEFEKTIAANKEHARTLKLWLAARLIPEQVIFANKGSLKRTLLLPILMRWSAAAAVVAFGLFFATNNPTDSDKYSSQIRWDQTTEEISHEQATLERIYQKLGVNPVRKVNEPYTASVIEIAAPGSTKKQINKSESTEIATLTQTASVDEVAMPTLKPKRVRMSPEVIMVSNGLTLTPSGENTLNAENTNNTNKNDIESIQEQLERRYNELKTATISVEPSTVYSAIKKVSGNRVSINTNKQGKADRIQIDGGIFAFSIPVSKRK